MLEKPRVEELLQTLRIDGMISAIEFCIQNQVLPSDIHKLKVELYDDFVWGSGNKQNMSDFHQLEALQRWLNNEYTALLYQ